MVSLPSFHPFTPSPLHPFTPSPLHPFTPSPLHPFTPSPFHPFTLSSLLSVFNLLAQRLYKIFAGVEAGLPEGDFAFAVEDDRGRDRRDREKVVQVIGVGDRKIEFVLL